MKEIIDRLRSRLRAKQNLKEFWLRDIAGNEKAIAEEEAKQYAAHELSAAFNGLELNEEEIAWIKGEHQTPADVIKLKRQLIQFAESDVEKCENEMRLLEGMIEKLEVKEK